MQTLGDGSRLSATEAQPPEPELIPPDGDVAPNGGITGEIADITDELVDAAEGIIRELPGYAGTLIRVAVVLVLAVGLTFIVRRIIRRFERRMGGESTDATRDVSQKRAQTLGGVLRASTAAVIGTVTILVVLDQSGVDIGPLIAAAGIGGIAIGFGAQHLIRDLIGGFFVLLEDQYHVGDIVQIAGVAGVVERITLRTTVLRDLEGRRHVVPNGEVHVSTNLTKGFSRYVIVVPVPYDEDIDRVIGIVRDAFDEMRREPDYSGLILAPLEVLGVDDYGDSQIDLKVFAETVPGKQWLVGREFRKRIKNAFDAAGISIPFPHRQVILQAAPPFDHGEAAQPPRPPAEPGERPQGVH